MIGHVFVGPLDGSSRIYMPHVTVGVPRLSAALDGLRIALLADLHYGRFVHLSYVRRVNRLLRRVRPDVVVMCGDMVERSVGSRPAELAGAFAELAADIPTYAVLGNHEYYGAVDGYCRCLRAAGVELLINEHRLIRRTGRASGPALALVGLDDCVEGTPDLQAARRGIPAGTTTLLAGHNPDLVDCLAPDTGIALMLAGHTHGGQVRILGWAPITFTRHRSYLSGLTAGPGFPIYISPGLGMTGMPLRIGTRAELPILTLRSDSQ